MTALRRITEIPCHCDVCTWHGITGDCEPDDEGDLTCPYCALAGRVRRVVIEYNEHERNPK